MKTFVSRFGASIYGVLNGFDRIRFRGTQRLLASVQGLSRFLAFQGVLLKDFKSYVTGVTEQIRQRMLRAHGVIRKVPSTHRYQVTERGRELIVGLTTAYDANPLKFQGAA